MALLVASGNVYGYDLHKEVVSFRLANGMRWLVVKKRQAPVFSGVVMVRVGGADEALGKTGLAHMFEHMAFKGSKSIGTRDFLKEKPLLDEINHFGRELTTLKYSGGDKDQQTKLSEKLQAALARAAEYQNPNEVWEVMSRNGAADLNAFTTKDLTAYHASMPNNRLDLWAYVISQMVADPVLRDFYTERDVVAEERRTSVENDPDGALAEAILNVAYVDGPYHWSTIGLKEDIGGLNDLDARAFHRKHYVASNMVGVLVGDIEVWRAKEVAEHYFGSIPPGKQGVDPIASAERAGIRKRLSMRARPSFVVGFHKPTLPHPDEYVFDVISSLLCDGPASRLERQLVIEKRLVRQLDCSDAYPGARLPNLWILWIEPIAGRSIANIEQIVMDEFSKLRVLPVQKEELERVTRKAQADHVFVLEENMGLALALARFETVFGDWRILADYPERLRRVTADDIMRVANRYFVEKNMVLVERVNKKR